MLYCGIFIINCITGIPQALIMTKVDETCPLVKVDLEKIYTSKKNKTEGIVHSLCDQGKFGTDIIISCTFHGKLKVLIYNPK